MMSRIHHEQWCENNDKWGWYELLLPWADIKSELEDNKIIGEKRLLVTTNKLVREKTEGVWWCCQIMEGNENNKTGWWREIDYRLLFTTSNNPQLN